MNKDMLIKLDQKTKIWIAAGTVLFLVVTFSNILVSPALDFLSAVSGRMLISLGLAMELKSMASSIKSTNIPLIEGNAAELYDTFDKAVDYLALANIAIAVQTILVNLCKSWLFMLLPVVFLAGVFIKKYSQMAIRLLVIVLLINPGLPIYVVGMNYASQSLQVSLGSKLQARLSATKSKYEKKQKENKEKQEARKQRQLKKAKAKGHDDIGLIKKAEDAVIGTAEDIGTTVGEGFSDLLDTLKEGKKELMILIINLISSLIVLFVLLPLLYFYFVGFILKKFFHFSMLKEMKAIESEGIKGLEQDMENEWKKNS